MITKEEKDLIASKFLNDPSWVIIEKLIEEYIEPLRDIGTIDLNRGADAVMADVAGRQKAYDSMVAFLRDCRILKKTSINSNISFK